MESKDGNIFWIVILVVLLLMSYSKNDSLSKENSMLKTSVDDYRSALYTANANIDEANSVIEDAQSYAWSDYDSMGYALSDMYTVSNVPEPY